MYWTEAWLKSMCWEASILLLGRTLNHSKCSQPHLLAKNLWETCNEQAGRDFIHIMWLITDLSMLVKYMIVDCTKVFDLYNILYLLSWSTTTKICNTSTN